MSFREKVVWITGASSGIGEALAIELARQGARLVLSARREDELRRVAGLAGILPDNLFILPLDMARPDDFPQLVQAVTARFGQIDYVFQNAGITQRGLVSETALPVFQQLFDVNFFGVVALTKAILPVMQQQGSGHFVVTSSVAGKIGTKMRSGYCATKHALHGFFDSLRAEVYEQGLRVTIVCPGYIRTPISLHALNAKGEKHGRMDDNQTKGMAPEVFARKLTRAVLRSKNEVYIGGYEVVGIYLQRFFPGLLSYILRRRKPE
ncbi:SDR family oxidoreductase [Arsenicibacter rosenii]|uniref:Short-chain dehydrogenase n=1 Tax=Arsenicibacter rosenii TaxID=1750698 RepID=A0A1S2VKJ1_9BACT|nr:SDR family oxidoreductase [Arsenicibacter rosenii]OIN59307.1 short-chain dehydrogenase [Arsenicibacter rosenii]